MPHQDRKSIFENQAVAQQLWQLITLAEDSDMTLEAMELRRLFAEQEHRLTSHALSELARLASANDLPAAAAWCEKEAKARNYAAPGFFRRLKFLLEGKSTADRRTSIRPESLDSEKSVQNEVGSEGLIVHDGERRRTMPR
mgnify:CR=1 FL=1